MAKTTIESHVTHDVVQVDEQGEIISQEHSETTGTKTIHKQEPSYIKLYLQNILYMNDMPRTLTGVMGSLLSRASYAGDDEGLCVILAPYVKQKILAECGWDKMQTLNNALAKLVKGHIIKRLGTGAYQLNPYLFGRGEWKDIEKIRVAWEYDFTSAVQGRTFHSHFTYATSDQDQNTLDQDPAGSGQNEQPATEPEAKQEEKKPAKRRRKTTTESEAKPEEPVKPKKTNRRKRSDKNNGGDVLQTGDVLLSGAEEPA